MGAWACGLGVPLPNWRVCLIAQGNSRTTKPSANGAIQGALLYLMRLFYGWVTISDVQWLSVEVESRGAVQYAHVHDHTGSFEPVNLLSQCISAARQCSALSHPFSLSLCVLE